MQKRLVLVYTNIFSDKIFVDLVAGNDEKTAEWLADQQKSKKNVQGFIHESR